MVEALVETIDLAKMGKGARASAGILAKKSTTEKNALLHAVADALEANTPSILEANTEDIILAEASGVDPIWIRDRIALDRRMAGIIADVRKVAELPDPVGEVLLDTRLENGLQLLKRRTPLGVLGRDI